MKENELNIINKYFIDISYILNWLCYLLLRSQFQILSLTYLGYVYFMKHLFLIKTFQIDYVIERLMWKYHFPIFLIHFISIH